MTGPFLSLVLALGLLLLAYALLDALLRRELALRAPPAWLVAGAGLAVLLAPRWTWPNTLPIQLLPSWPAEDGIRWLCVILVVLTAWNAATRDRDPVAGGPSSPERGLLMALAFASVASPSFALLATAQLSLRFRFWQHHASFPMRALLMLCSFVLLDGGLRWLVSLGSLPFAAPVIERLPSALVLLLLTLVVSHYFITALAKLVLGPRPWSWATQNRLHFLAASSYSWGWARFIPWPKYRIFVGAIKRLEWPLQIGVFALELVVILAYLDARLAVAMCLAFVGFHAGVFLVSGLLFWDWMLTDSLVALLLWGLPQELRTELFGAEALLLGVLVLGAFPLRHKLWKPMPLGWYDSPLTQRVIYRARGESGRVYGIYNDFMCPHERLYGKVQGCFAFVGEVVTYHLGEVFRLPLRDAIVRAGANPSELARVKANFGIEPWSAELTQQHLRYLKAYFDALNAGAPKAVLPAALRFLKAPGEQFYYWGELPAYRRQEPVTSIELLYREEYFDGERHVRLADELLWRVPIRSRSDVSLTSLAASKERSLVRELTPRQLDDHLLLLAQGRLIELPGFKRAYLGGDDGPSTSSVKPDFAASSPSSLP